MRNPPSFNKSSIKYLALIFLACLLHLVFWNEVCRSQEKGENESDGGDLRSAVQNPISSLISLPLNLPLILAHPTGKLHF